MNHTKFIDALFRVSQEFPIFGGIWLGEHDNPIYHPSHVNEVYKAPICVVLENTISNNLAAHHEGLRGSESSNSYGPSSYR